MIRIGANMLPPMQWSAYVAAHPGAAVASLGCEHDSTRDLDIANQAVNRGMRRAGGYPPAPADPWTPWRAPAGWCGDFAVAKRELLLRLGWPSAALRIAEVATASGDYHAVLVATMDGSDVVLDSLRWSMLTPAACHYRWIKIQSDDDPNRWLAVESVD